ncbi:MAG: fumarate hydratase C-terminal domain-containing protein [Patescibacteria group bacterium]|jgi:tartrate/fumarate subfamily iron-sulfur-dependent hydro-lyase beta chain
MINLHTPLVSDQIKKLKVGDQVLLSGTIFTARDQAYNYLLKNNFSKIKNGVIYHAGPIVLEKKGKTIPVSAGPTTSSRFSLKSIKLIQKYGIKAFIGKGGMDDDAVKKAMKGKTVYLAAVGGAGVVYANAMKIKKIYLKKLGMADAICELEVKDMPLIVTMDSQGRSIYHDVYKKSRKITKQFLHEDI